MSKTILRLDASMRQSGSVSRELATQLIEKLSASGATVTTRDLTSGISLIDEAWIGANFTKEPERTAEQKATLATSDALIAELKAADILVIGAPIYNFSVPGALKAWIDQICRAGVTFSYTSNGPVGLLEGKTAYIVVASGGVPVDSPVDFMTPYLKQVLAFIGITDVHVIDGAGLVSDETGARARAAEQIAAVSA